VQANAWIVATGENCTTPYENAPFTVDESWKSAGICYDNEWYQLFATQSNNRVCWDLLVTWWCGDGLRLPPGSDTMDGTAWGGLTVEDILRS
jgi:hypothetical protein